MRAVEFGGRMRTVNAEGRMRTVESRGCGRSKSDADSQIRKSYFWHELSSILLYCHTQPLWSEYTEGGNIKHLSQTDM